MENFVDKEEQDTLSLVLNQSKQYFTPRSRKINLRLQRKMVEIEQFSDWKVTMGEKQCCFAVYQLNEQVILFEAKGTITTFFARRGGELLRQAMLRVTSSKPALLLDFRGVVGLPINSRLRLKEIAGQLKNLVSEVALLPSDVVQAIHDSYWQDQPSPSPILLFEKPDDAVLFFLDKDTEVTKKKEHQKSELERKMLRLIHRLGWELPQTSLVKRNLLRSDPLINSLNLLETDIQERLASLQEENKLLERKASTHTEISAENEANLVSLIENTSDLIHSVDQGLNVLVANSAFKDFMRKTRKINIREGKSIFDGYEENEIEFWRPFYKRALEGRSSKTIKEENIRDTFYSFEISFNPILKAENQVTGVTVFIKDITAQQEAEQQMKQQNDELLKVNNELDRFVYSVSHDLRAPLSSILGLINIARMEGLEPPHQNYYEMIEKSIRKLDEFIGDIINYSRNSRLHINKESIWFQPLIEDIFNSIALNEYPVNPKLTVSVQQNIPYFSDKERLSMILENLISNAVRYQKSDEPNPSVKVNVIVKPKAAFIDVTDNGDGIEEEYQEKVFNMFYRASEKTTGSGLGLYIVNESLKKLGGKISVHSKFGEGSTFSIEVPNLSGQPQ